MVELECEFFSSFFSTLFDKGLDRLCLLNEAKVFTSSSKVYTKLTEASKLYVDCQRQQQSGHCSLKGLFSALSQERNLRPDIYSCSWIVRSPTLPQPDLSRYCEASAGKCAAKLSRVIDLMTRSVSSVDIPRPVDRFDPKLSHQKGEDLRQQQAGYRVHSSAREIEKFEFGCHDAFRRNSP